MTRVLLIMLSLFYSFHLEAQDPKVKIDDALFNNKMAKNDAEQFIKAYPTLLTWESPDGLSALDKALIHGNSTLALALVNNGIDLNVKYIKDSSPIEFAVVHAIEDPRFLPLIKAMLDRGADPFVMTGEVYVTSALQRAFALQRNNPYYDFQCAEENPENYKAIITMLLDAARKLEQERGLTIDPTAVPDNPNLIGDSLLHLAAGTGNVIGTEMLVAQGAPINARNHRGFTPLHDSVYHGNRRIMTLLLDHGAELEAQNEDGDSPLTLAVYTFRADACAILLERGARTDLKNKAGKSANDFSEADLTSAIKPYHTEKDIAEMKKAFKKIQTLLGKR